jgi:hypothetical protein
LADAYDALAKDDDFRTAIVSLCAGEATTEDGNVARLDVAAASDADRMSDITAWTSTHLRGKEAQGFVARMAAASVKERSGLLLAEAAKFKIAPCPLATVLGQPPPPTVAREVVALPSFNVTSVEPASAQHSVAEAFSNGAAPQVVNACYGPALVKTPQLGGTIALRLTLDARGRLTKVEEGGSSFGNATVIKCIVNGLSGTTLLAASELGARTPAASFKWSMSLSLTPIRGIPPAGWPNFPFPSASSDGFPVDAGAADAGKKKKGR